jgi:hypothetical protein
LRFSLILGGGHVRDRRPETDIGIATNAAGLGVRLDPDKGAGINLRSPATFALSSGGG